MCVGTDQFLTEHPRLIEQCSQSNEPEEPYASACKRILEKDQGYVIGVMDMCLCADHVVTLIFHSQYTSKFMYPFMHEYSNIVFVLNCGYRSESPTQVFVILLQWLFENLSCIPEDQWSEVIIAYDNMCQLDSLQLAKNPLPLPSPFDKMWMAVRKVCHMLLYKDKVHF